jgi:hypothetical protein
MEFAKQNFDSDGRAALALVVALIKKLNEIGGLPKGGAADVINLAAHLLPSAEGRLDAQAREIVETVRMEIR